MRNSIINIIKETKQKQMSEENGEKSTTSDFTNDLNIEFLTQTRIQLVSYSI